MFPFFHDYPYSDLHEIDLAYMQMLVASIEGNNKQLLAWKATHEKEYAELAEKVEGLIENLVDVIVPWDSSISYRIFSIVEYQGTNYIAIQDVPVGTMITNTDYWQPANTVVEQINAIGEIAADLQRYAINDGIGLVFPKLEGDYDPAGLCCAFYTGEGHATLIDMGRSEVFTSIKKTLDAAGVRFIDNIFITHFHGDHTGEAYGTDYSAAYDNWKNNYDMRNTVFYIPPEATTFNADTPAKLRASFPNNEIITMMQGGVYNWEGIKFTPYNISSSDYAYYDQESPTDYNAYSAIIYAEYGNSRFLCTGDVNPIAQARCYTMKYTKHADIVTIPHHGVNGSGDQNFINDIAPLYSYVPSGSDVNKMGFRGPELFTASLYGPVFSNRELNKYGISFVFGKAGISVTGGHAELISGYSSESYRTVYVNEQYTGGNENGTIDKPYSNIRRAINSCKGITEIILNSDITLSPIFNSNNGKITVEGNNHSVGYCGILGAQIEFKNVTFNSNLTADDSMIVLNACTFNNTIRFNRSHATITNCTFNHDGTKIDGVKSFITVEGPTGTNTATGNFTDLSECFLTGTFGLGSLGSGNKIVNRRGYTDFGRLVESAGVLSTLFNQAGGPPFTYETDTGKLRIMTTNGTVYHIPA